MYYFFKARLLLKFHYRGRIDWGGVCLAPFTVSIGQPDQEVTPFVVDAKCAMKYELFGMLVHSGKSPHGGHYYSYVRAAGKANTFLSSNFRNSSFWISEKSFNFSIKIIARTWVRLTTRALPGKARVVKFCNLATRALPDKIWTWFGFYQVSTCGKVIKL